MISHEWIDAVQEALKYEYDEELANRKILEGYSLDLFRGDVALIKQQLRSTREYALGDLRDAGLAITHLKYKETKMSKNIDQIMLVLEKEKGHEEEGSTFRPRDLTLLFDHKKRLLFTGSIYNMTDKFITMLLNEFDDDIPKGPFIMTKGESDATYKYNQRVLAALKADEQIGGLGRFFVQKFFGQQGESKAVPVDIGQTSLLVQEMSKKGRSEAQSAAINAISTLNQHQYLIVHGPPGTGKTTTLSDAIAAYLENPANQDKRVLITGPSNVAVDNLLSKLCQLRHSKVRIGSLNRLTDERLEYFLLDAVVQRQYKTELQSCVEDFQAASRNVQTQQKKMSKTGDKKSFYEAKKEQRRAMKQMSKQQKDLSEEVLRQTRMIFATLSGCSGAHVLKAAAMSEGFDLVVVDEGGQALDIQLIGALLLCKGSVVLCGDPMQLSPTIRSRMAQNIKPFCSRLLEREVQKALSALETLPSTCWTAQNYILLNKTYRFGEMVNSFPSEAFYQGRLKSALSDAREISDIFKTPVCYIDTSSMDDNEEHQGSSIEQLCQTSISNKLEAKIAEGVIRALENSNIHAEDVGIITPYAAQVTLLRQHVPNAAIEISTVDGFQGREKRVIILSMVRSNNRGNVGFVSDKQRLNVSITRCKDLLVVIGDMLTLENDELLGNYVTWLRDNATSIAEDEKWV